MLTAVLAVVALPAVADSVVRAILALLARRWRFDVSQAARLDHVLVIVPAQGEGAAVEPTVASLAAAVRGHTVTVVVVLDGDDPEAAAVCARLGVTTAVKSPAGPSKGAALAWAVEYFADEISSADAVLVVDVGSVVGPAFFEHFLWPEGAAAVQTFLAGQGEGVGAAAVVSERAAQCWEDRGRERLGWAVRLRGTGTAMRPDVFAAIAPLMRTRIEDIEASVVLASRGQAIRMAPEQAQVADVKPESAGDIARQRARWLIGRFALPFRQPAAIGRLLVRHPLEGAAFVLELLGRPLSLSGILRVAVAVLLLLPPEGAPALWRVVIAGLALASVGLDIFLLRLSGGLTWRNAAGMVMAWVGAVAMAPRAAFGWAKVRRR